jgi:hypothetical protein
MRKSILLFLVTGAFVMSVSAQDTLWRKGGILGANLSQASYSDWAAGGQNSFSVTGLFSLFSNYQAKDSTVTWENSLDMAYGKIQVFGKKDLQKIDDKIDLNSAYNKLAFGKGWYYSFLFNFKSQFDKGYNYPNDSVIASGFMSPGYFIYAFGLQFKPEKEFSILIAPLTGKTTVVSDQALADSGAYGVIKATYDTAGKLTTHGKNIRNQFGGLIQVHIKKEIVKNVSIDTKAEIFSDYLKNPTNLDVYWDLKFEMKVNNFLSVSVNTTLIYDDDIIIRRDSNGDGSFEVNGPRTQFKEVLGVGLAYKFGSKK